jgi:hypothetical protein
MPLRLSILNPHINQIVAPPINPAVHNNDGGVFNDEASVAIINVPESFTGSIKYSKPNEGKAININIIAGVMVQINSINVIQKYSIFDWFKYLCEI